MALGERISLKNPNECMGGTARSLGKPPLPSGWKVIHRLAMRKAVERLEVSSRTRMAKSSRASLTY